MTQEEKAKAYDELIERLKDLRFAYRFSPLSDIIEEKFPELKESEDEKIKKWLIGFFNQYKIDGFPEFSTGMKVDNIIAWLEKQGESDETKANETAIKDTKEKYLLKDLL